MLKVMQKPASFAGLSYLPQQGQGAHVLSGQGTGWAAQSCTKFSPGTFLTANRNVTTEINCQPEAFWCFKLIKTYCTTKSYLFSGTQVSLDILGVWDACLSQSQHKEQSFWLPAVATHSSKLNWWPYTRIQDFHLNHQRFLDSVL